MSQISPLTKTAAAIIRPTVRLQAAKYRRPCFQLPSAAAPNRNVSSKMTPIDPQKMRN